MKIGEVAARSGASARSLRYYEQQSLLSAERTPGGQREYTDGTVERVRLIRQLLAAGLGSQAIAGLLPCVHTGAATVPMLTRLAAERDRIDGQVRELAATRDRLDEVIAAARRGTQGSPAGGCGTC